ncbi:hypothetical protein DM01DRAFT_1311136 [Hesseltinella vesiculosa]|uniref:EI24-domain-containing protein n=1 Tax=Hesseltinella vesiculosa TaxID=101127 RepID=A0A1X2G6E4_9FUNG|nr:hypothetical protein DM01DRAFT_1311136 [Hesseltinella vesiculosa]
MPTLYSKPLIVSYPVLGACHLYRHPRRLGKPIVISTLKACAVSLLALGPLYLFGYRWQARMFRRLFAFLSDHPDAGASMMQQFGNSSLATMASGLACLVESMFVTTQTSQLYIGSVRERFFDAVLETEGMLIEKGQDEQHHGYKKSWLVAQDVVTQGQQEQSKVPLVWPLHPLMTVCARKDAKRFPLVLVPSLVYFVGLPLTMIPTLGPVAFLGLQGACQGGICHRRYFDLAGHDDTQRQDWLQSHFWQYQQFGMVASLLEMIPFIGFFFAYTNQVGAALWLVDMNKRQS